MEKKLSVKTRILNQFRKIFQYPLLERWLRQKTQNKLSDTFWGKLVPNNYQYPESSIRIFNTQEGLILKVDIHDWVGHNLYFGFKDISQESLFNLIKEGFYILDIGSNIGHTLLKMAKLTGPSGRVYGFEPDPLNYQRAVENIALNPFLKNVFIENIGLGDQEGLYQIVTPTPTNRGGNRIQIGISEYETSSVPVQVRRLDDWVKEKSIEHIDLIKIDVEGFELRVLQGGYNTICSFNPILFIEVDDENLKSFENSAKQLVSFLEDIGYSLICAQTNEPIHSKINFEGCHIDVIGIKESKKH